MYKGSLDRIGIVDAKQSGKGQQPLDGPVQRQATW